MNIIGKIINEIKKCMVKHSRRPNLILIGEKEQEELFVQNQMKFPSVSKFMGVRIIYTKEEHELRALTY